MTPTDGSGLTPAPRSGARATGAGWPKLVEDVSSDGPLGDAGSEWSLCTRLPDPVCVVVPAARTAARFRFALVNDAFGARFSCDTDVVGRDLDDVLPPTIAAPLHQHLVDAASARETVHFEVRVGTDHATVAFDLVPSNDDGGSVQSILCVARDVTQLRRLEADLEYRARFDSLTDLPNRVLLVERLSEALHEHAAGDAFVGLIFLDLDDFKVVNDSLGHHAGDELLRVIARRAERVLRGGDTVARFGGDEFAVVCRDAQSLDDLRAVAERVRRLFDEPFVLDGSEVFLSASFGIAMSFGPGDEPERLLRDADAAMFVAKELGRGRVEVFDERMRARVVERLEIGGALRQALLRREFVIHYQPLVQFERSQVIGFEALLRWQHPERGLLGPYEFIGVAEETGLIVPIGAWVLHEACAQGARWTRESNRAEALAVSVNLSARQLADPALVDTVAEALERSGLDPGLLVLEITESVLMNDRDLAVRILNELRALGVRLSVDDFGTGQSSLGYLKTLPVHSLKIDRSFIDGLGTDPDDSAIVAAVVSLGHALGLEVTAEGIETPLQLSELRSLGCDLGQGFYFARPQPGEVAGALVHNRFQWRTRPLAS